MSPTQRHRDGGGWEAEAGYSRAVRRSNFVSVSGTTANGPDGRVLHPGDTLAQTRAAIAAALDALQALGATKEDVVRSRIYLTPDAAWQDAARAHAELLGEVAPANTMLRVFALIGEGFLVEVELDAVIEAA